MKTIVSFALMSLVLSIIFSGTPITVEAQTDTNILMKLATQAEREIKNQISEDTSDEIKDLFEKASLEVHLIEESLANDDIPSAKQHFLSAMQMFKRISQMVTTAETTTIQAVTTRDTVSRDLMSNLERIAKYLSSLKSIAKKHNATIDSTDIENLIESTKNNIQNGNLNKAKENINQIERLIIDINKTLREYANQAKAQHAKAFAQTYLNILDRLIEQAKNEDFPQTIIEKLETAREKLATVSDPQEIIQQVRHIISIKEQFDLTKIDRIESRVDQIEKRLERLSNIDGIDLAMLEDARLLLLEIKESISNKNFDVALDLLRTLTEVVNKLESSVL